MGQFSTEPNGKSDHMVIIDRVSRENRRRNYPLYPLHMKGVRKAWLTHIEREREGEEAPFEPLMLLPGPPGAKVYEAVPQKLRDLVLRALYIYIDSENTEYCPDGQFKIDPEHTHYNILFYIFLTGHFS